MEKIKPQYPTHPGTLLREELEARGVSQKEFAERIGMSASNLSEYIHDKRRFGTKTAQLLENALGIPAHVWLRLQAGYDERFPDPDAISTALDVSHKILSMTNINLGDSITNLKLQKLLYFFQGHFLAVFGRPLFPEDIQAWKYGPVVPEVYSEYKVLELFAIPSAGFGKCKKFPKEEEALFEKVYQKYNRFSASYLVTLTHDHAIWCNHKNEVIPKDEIQDFFRHCVSLD